jgi:hypothetical protein
VPAEEEINLMAQQQLFDAAQKDLFDDAEKAIKAGANPVSLSFFGSSALHTAAQYGALRTLKVLLASATTALVDITDDNGKTPLEVANLNGHIHCVNYLTSLGAKVPDYMGRSLNEEELDRWIVTVLQAPSSERMNISDLALTTVPSGQYLWVVAPNLEKRLERLGFGCVKIGGYDVVRPGSHPRNIEEPSKKSFLTQPERWVQGVLANKYPLGVRVMRLENETMPDGRRLRTLTGKHIQRWLERIPNITVEHLGCLDIARCTTR